jgi:hypothetical protein
MPITNWLRLFFGWKFVQNLRMKLYPKCFRPKWSLVKSIPWDWWWDVSGSSRGSWLRRTKNCRPYKLCWELQKGTHVVGMLNIRSNATLVESFFAESFYTWMVAKRHGKCGLLLLCREQNSTKSCAVGCTIDLFEDNPVPLCSFILIAMRNVKRAIDF